MLSSVFATSRSKKITVQLFIIVVSFRWTAAAIATQSEESCNSKIYCQGPILDHVQRAKIFPDSKQFVDMKLTLSVDKTLRDFEKLLKMTNNKPTKEQLETFVDTHFSSTSELESWSPPDFTRNPPFLNEISDLAVREFARTLVAIWPELARKVKPEVFQNPDRFSLIPLPNGFIVPGGRFKETYYWDSYWIIKGLLISNMHETARGMLDNFLILIKKFGFIPNGSRVYYLNRSQPPLFTMMVAAYIEATQDYDWLKKNIDLVDRELQFWLSKRTVDVVKGDKTYTLAHYSVNSDTPRPESYSEDINTASFFNNAEERAKCYMQLKSGAETGWDYSSRWFFDKDGGSNTNLTRIETSRVIPVDLNAYLCGSFKILQHFYEKLDHNENAKFWQSKNKEWENAIDSVLYDEEDGIWYDYDYILKKHRKAFFPSNLSPLWANAVPDSKIALLGDRVADYLNANNILDYVGGVPTSFEETGEQWDFPNAWPPLQSIIIFGLEKSKSTKARLISNELAKRWLAANVKGFRETGAMFEKYDAVHSGQHGGGGEYIVQSGFGWTNGVVLEIIDYFYRKQS